VNTSHLKPILWLVGGIAGMFAISLALQRQNNIRLLQRLSDDNLALLAQRERQNAENTFQTSENSVVNSIERGEMDKFVAGLKALRSIQGLQEFTLFDRNGIAAYSSYEARVNQPLPAALREQLRTDFTRLTRLTNDGYEIYHAQKIQADCLRCHLDWKEGDSAGVLLGRFSTDSLKQSQRQWSASLTGMKRSEMINGLATTVVVLLIFGTLAAFVMHYQMIAPLVRVLAKLTGVSDQVGNTSTQLRAGSQSIAEGASEQAAALEETGAALEELSATTRNNAAHARNANELAAQTRRAAETGAGGMAQMHAAMQEIQTAGGNIAKIIKTIDEIAFQTNLLALNAAVEAARAGSAGQGFAVVAEEVRRLAQRSAVAAKETADIIEDSIRKSKNGVQISAEVSRHFQEITDKARRVDEIIAQIATASQEQDQGIGQLNTSVRSLDAVTQTNAANAEESASVAVELNAQADTLRQIIAELSSLLSGKSKPPREEHDQSTTAPTLRGEIRRAPPARRQRPTKPEPAKNQVARESTSTF